jgi:uncharacterized protein (DUF934 family)
MVLRCLEAEEVCRADFWAMLRAVDALSTQGNVVLPLATSLRRRAYRRSF